MDPKIQRMAELLKQVELPGGYDVVSLKMIRELRLSGNRLSCHVYMGAQNQITKEELYNKMFEVLAAEFPGMELDAHFINQAPFSQAPNSVLPQVMNFIAVASGKGGVGKSTIAAHIAIALHKAGFTVGLLDADLYGPSIPTMLGIKNIRPEVREIEGKHKIVPIRVHGIPVLSLGNIIDPDQAVVLRGPRLSAIIKQFFNDALWPELDYMIIDLPPGTGDIQLTLVQTIPLTGVVMVTTPQEVAYIDAVKAANMFSMDQISVPILGVVENMSWFSPEDAPDKKYYIFGQGGGERLALKTNSGLLAQVPLREKLRENADFGHTMKLDSPYDVIFGKLVNTLDEKVKLRNLIYAPTSTVHPG